MKNYKLYIDVLYAVKTTLETDNIEIEVFGDQQYELLDNNQLNMTDIITLQAETALEAINKAYAIAKDRNIASNHIGYYTHEGTYGFLDVGYQTSHIHFANELDDEYEDLLEEINSEYYNLIA